MCIRDSSNCLFIILHSVLLKLAGLLGPDSLVWTFLDHSLTTLFVLTVLTPGVKAYVLLSIPFVGRKHYVYVAVWKLLKNRELFQKR